MKTLIILFISQYLVLTTLFSQNITLRPQNQIQKDCASRNIVDLVFEKGVLKAGYLWLLNESQPGYINQLDIIQANNEDNKYYAELKNIKTTKEWYLLLDKYKFVREIYQKIWNSAAGPGGFEKRKKSLIENEASLYIINGQIAFEYNRNNSKINDNRTVSNKVKLENNLSIR